LSYALLTVFCYNDPMSEFVKVREGHLRLNVKHSNETLIIRILRLCEIYHNLASRGIVKSFTNGGHQNKCSIDITKVVSVLTIRGLMVRGLMVRDQTTPKIGFLIYSNVG